MHQMAANEIDIIYVMWYLNNKNAKLDEESEKALNESVSRIISDFDEVDNVISESQELVKLINQIYPYET